MDEFDRFKLLFICDIFKCFWLDDSDLSCFFITIYCFDYFNLWNLCTDNIIKMISYLHFFFLLRSDACVLNKKFVEFSFSFIYKILFDIFEKKED